MEVTDVQRIIQLLENEDIDVWLDGGWGVDALLGEQTRSHKDLDVVISTNDAQKMQTILSNQGYKLVEGKAPSSFVLRDEQGREVDVHPVHFDEKGNGIYRMQNGKDWIYKAEGFTGKGRVGGREVRCLSPKMQMLCHTGYTLTEKDYREMDMLHERFGIDYPENYKGAVRKSSH